MTKHFTLLSTPEFSTMRPSTPHFLISIADVDRTRPILSTNIYRKYSVIMLFPRQDLLKLDNETLLLKKAEMILHPLSERSDLNWIVIQSDQAKCRGPTIAAGLEFIFNGRGSENRYFQNSEYIIDNRLFSAMITVGLRMGLI